MKPQETLSQIVIHRLLSRLNARQIEVGKFFTTFRYEGLFYEIYNHKVREDMDILEIIETSKD